MSDFKKIVEGNLQYFLDYFDTRPLDFNTDKYERNIVFLGCSLTYGQGVENQDTYPSKVQQLSDNKWNCLNFGVQGGSLDLIGVIYNKVIKEIDIDCVVVQWPSLYRRMYFNDGEYVGYHVNISNEISKHFAKVSDEYYCVVRNLSNLQILNSFKNTFNLSRIVGQELRELFEFYNIHNILEFPFKGSIAGILDEVDDKYKLKNDLHPNEKWYEKYSKYLYKELVNVV